MPTLTKRRPAAVRRFALGDDLVLTDDWITVAQATKAFKYDAEYLRQLIRKGRVKAEKFPGTRVWVIFKPSLVAHVKHMKQLGDDKFNSHRNGD